MARVVSRNKVASYDGFRKAYDDPESVALRRDLGITDQQIFRNPEDPNEIVILTEAADLERLEQSPQLREAMRRGGIQERIVYRSQD